MVDKETHIRPIGYGAMLIEGLVGVLALIAASAMHPGDYFAINTTKEVYATLMSTVNLAVLEQAVGEAVAGRASGAVSLAGDGANLHPLPGMSGLMAYWHHFAIMFEALFILTTIDAGTRVGRFRCRSSGRIYAPFANTSWIPVFHFDFPDRVRVGLLHLHGQRDDDLAHVRRCQPAAWLRGAVHGDDHPINMGKARYAWITGAPASFLAVNTLWGAFLNIRDNYYPMATGLNEAARFQGWVLTLSSVIIIVCAVVILGAAIRKWAVLPTGGGPAPLRPRASFVFKFARALLCFGRLPSQTGDCLPKG